MTLNSPDRIWPHDPPYRWFVESHTNPKEPHLVDLLAYEGNGECSCEHFQYRLHPVVRRGEAMTPMRCRHIKLAREHLADLWIHHGVREQRRKAKGNL